MLQFAQRQKKNKFNTFCRGKGLRTFCSFA